jgi:benzoyl-CoA 2,3-dioxygenase component B
VDRWNLVIQKSGIDFELKLPSRRFYRHMGIFATEQFTPDGEPISEAEWNKHRDAWLPSQADLDYVGSLMQPVYEIGKIANWIAPPSKGIHGKPFEFEYVKLS